MMVKSKFSGDTIFWSIFMQIPLVCFIIFPIKIIKGYSGKLVETLILLFVIILFYFLINFLKHIKFIEIKDGKLKYYSIFRPFGRTIDLADYIGKVILTETGTRGSYKSVYLVNAQNKTSFKIMGLHYKNFAELNRGIPLKTIKYPPGIIRYLKILFFERVSIK